MNCLRKMKMNKVLYIAEGETEERFVKYLTSNDIIMAGRFAKFNLMQDKMKNTNNILTRTFEKVCGIIDTDCMEIENLDKLIHNVDKLKYICPKIYILVQNKNFEGELRYILNHKNLNEYFGLKNKTSRDLKVFLAQSVNYKNHISSDNIKIYCCRFESFIDKLKECKKAISEKIVVSVEICLISR